MFWWDVAALRAGLASAYGGLECEIATAARVSIPHSRDPLKIKALFPVIFHVHGLICKISVAPLAKNPSPHPILFVPSVNSVIVAYCTTIYNGGNPAFLDVLLNDRP